MNKTILKSLWSDEESEMTIDPSTFMGPNFVQAGASDSDTEVDEISDIESIPSIKAEKEVVEKTINKKLGAGMADVLFTLGDDDLDALNDDCKSLRYCNCIRT